ncbi:glutathione S-transferase N-terminal domain-containing protein, partial [Salmonella enterica]|uniref:glutathione S-transferase N-terminal domain-containing protein n=1 Tax=Salmonella enterica TaxID=28901 RepID=UPI001F182EE4
LVPTLVTDDGESLGQSLAIVDWLDRHFPQTPLLPTSDPARSQGINNQLPLRWESSISSLTPLCITCTTTRCASASTPEIAKPGL